MGVVPLAVINDKDAENEETLTASLTLPVQSLSNQKVLLAPNTTRVKICDNDGITTAQLLLANLYQSLAYNYLQWLMLDSFHNTML